LIDIQLLNRSNDPYEKKDKPGPMLIIYSIVQVAPPLSKH